MDVVFSRLSSRILITAIVVLCSGALLFASGRLWLSTHLAHTRDPADWMRTVKIEPDNAADWDQLGLYEEWDFQHGSIPRAIRDFERAAQLNPRSYQIWSHLASAYEASGRMQQARRAYEKAQALYPVSADMAWQYGSFLLRQGDIQEAARQVRGALEKKPKLAPSAISQFWEAGVGIGPIFDQVLPARRQDYLAALNYFVAQNDATAALASWEKLAGLGRKIPLDASFGLTNHLIALGRFAEAGRVWRQAVKLAGRGDENGPDGSLIFNGGFEKNLVDGGLGWRWTPTPGAALDLVGTITHGGAQSARVTFDGTANSDFAGLRQYVAISPATSYRFSAYMRTDAISTDSGPRFAIWTCSRPAQRLAQTTPMTGTHPWTRVQTAFTTGKDVSCIDVMLRRPPSQMFDNRIEGMVWVDGVGLRPAPAGKGPSR